MAILGIYVRYQGGISSLYDDGKKTYVLLFSCWLKLQDK